MDRTPATLLLTTLGLVLTVGFPLNGAGGAVDTLTRVPPANVTPTTTPAALNAAAKTPIPSPSAPAKEGPFYQKYNYYGDRYRDPFIPLIGQSFSDQFADRPPQIASLMLKGIIEDSNGRAALLTSGVSSYVLKGGRLYDGRNHMMRGISGVVKTNSVILIGSDHTVREIHVKTVL